jgi:hypothetical protein
MRGLDDIVIGEARTLLAAVLDSYIPASCVDKGHISAFVRRISVSSIYTSHMLERQWILATGAWLKSYHSTRSSPDSSSGSSSEDRVVADKASSRIKALCC